MKRLSVVLACTIFGLVICVPSAAFAHAALASSNPRDDARIKVMPGKVSLTLNEPIREPASISVTGQDGSRINSKLVTVQDKTAASEITQTAPAGSYKMNYRIVSTDGHPVAGTIEFEVLEGETSTPTPTPTPTQTLSDPSEEFDDASSPPAASSATKDALTVLGFFVVAMAGLIMLVRAGLKSSNDEAEKDVG